MPEMIAIVTVGVALVGLMMALCGFILQAQRNLRAEIGGRMELIDDRMADLGDRVFRMERMLHRHFARDEEPPAG